MLELIPTIELGLVATAVAIGAKYLRLPYTVALVVAGLGLGVSRVLDLSLSKELILVLFLPPLLFEGALHMDLDGLRRHARAIGLLAVVGTLLSAFLIGVIARLVLGLDWPYAFLLGVILSPTDPVSVLAMFKEYGVPKGLQTVLEGESVFNDGLGIVAYLIVLGVVGGEGFSPAGASLEFVRVALGGAAVGLGSGYLAYRLLGRLDDHLLEVMISLLLAYGSYSLAEAFHLSGVMAVAGAGLIIGNYGTVYSMSPTTRLSLVNFWSVAAFLVNSAVFLLIGLDFDATRLPGNLAAISVAILAMLVSRAVVVYGLVPLANRLGPPSSRVPLAWMHVLNWGGLRGSIPIALVLGLSPAVREVALPTAGADFHFPTVVFGVVLFSLLVQGLTIKPLLARLGLSGAGPHQLEYETRLAQTIALGAGLEEVQRLRSRGEIGPELFEHTVTELGGERATAMAELERLSRAFPKLQSTQTERLHRSLGSAEKAAVIEAARQGLIGEEAAAAVSERVDAALELGQRPSFSPEPGD